MALIDKDAAIEAISMYLFINDAIVRTQPMRVADYKVFAESILKEVDIVEERTYCGGCAKWHPSGFPDTGACEQIHDFTDKMDWCSRAKKKEEPKKVPPKRLTFVHTEKERASDD